MRFVFPILLTSLILLPSMAAGVNLADLEALYLEHNLFHRSRQAYLKAVPGRVRTAGQRPNPSANAVVESLRNGERETETTLSFRQELEKTDIIVSLGLAFPALTIEGKLPSSFLNVEGKALAGQAIAHCPDLKGLEATLESLQASEENIRRSGKGPFEFEVGYKGRTGGFNGFILGVSTPLPWSHRNEGEISSIHGETEAVRLKLRAEKELLLEINEALLVYWSTVLDLETVTGASLIAEEETK